ncbi:MAG: hypothetical protein F6K04_07485, partial [Leptolyngbya sp. SIO4C5]|nr:hypothetical protein [Leptolyngbya sp. SIO4C5]
MKAFLARDLLKLNDCGCCEGITYRTPVGVFNRAGLAAIAYRVGTHDQFKQSLLAQLSRAELPALQALTTRDEDDFAIALLDAWATVADVLTFYQERIAQESYLRTATERLSIRELARLIGYQLRPGVAASTPLAFTLDTAPTSPPQITLAAGTKVQSIPGKDEQAQMFETVNAIAARTAWNAMRPRLTQPQTAASLQESLTVQGTATRIQQGDKLLIVYPGSATEPDFVTVFRVTVNQDAGTTRLDLAREPSQMPPFGEPTFPVAVMPTGAIALNQAAIQNQIIGKSWSQKDLVAFTEIQDWHQADLTASVMSQLAEIDQPAEVYVFRLTAAVFGYNAAKKVVYLTSGDNVGKPDTSGGELKFTEWQPADDELDDILFLDNAYKEITEDSYVAISTISSPIDDLTAGALETNAFGLGAPILATLINTTNNTTNNLAADSITDAPNTTLNLFAETASVKSYQVETVLERSRTAYGLSGKTTQITLNQAWWNHNANNAFGNTIRKATVYAQSEQLTLTALPITDTVAGNTITLDGFYLGLQPGQLLILSGERHDLEGVTQSETLTLKDITIQSGYTQITLQAELAHPYKRNTVTINANVAPATHGETVQEILGSGDASQPYQAFNLRQPPLTYVSSDAAPSGALSTLEVRVNDIRWHEAPMLYGQKPSDRIYITRQTEDGKTEVKFGDGKTGARLLTGTNNVEATYRKGIGLAGNVKANQLTALMSRPLGLKAVTNPLP